MPGAGNGQVIKHAAPIGWSAKRAASRPPLIGGAVELTGQGGAGGAHLMLIFPQSRFFVEDCNDAKACRQQAKAAHQGGTAR